MHIIIPMSGIGSRFIESGYLEPKPLITIDQKPMIEHVCNLFPGEDKFTFICNTDHLVNTNLRKILLNIKPNGNILEIQNHKKGPVYAVSLAKEFIEDDEEVIVNYCDFGTYWDYEDFLKHTRDRNADGAIPSYKGFHPHMLGSTNYAFIRDKHQWMLEIKEKEPFTTNRMNEYASNGTYYFKKGLYVKKYFQDLMKKDMDVKGEYYVSLVFNLLVKDNLKVSIYKIQHMLQWGTPQDVAQYKSWSKYFKNIINYKNTFFVNDKSVTLIPLAGKGSRFLKSGYNKPKPLIDISGKPMIVQAAKLIPSSQIKIFVALKEHLKEYNLEQILKDHFKGSKIISVDQVSEGQAITCSLGLKNLNCDLPLLVSATDSGIIYNQKEFQQLKADEKVDAVIFTFRHHISSQMNPQMYGWVKTDKNNRATYVSVKKQISDHPYEDHAIVGTFWFKKIQYFNQGLECIIKKHVRVNNEYYIDSLMGELIKLDLNVKVFEVEDYICWGTPNDYETFLYWQSFFHKAKWHPYRLDKDPTVNKEKIKILHQQYSYFEQEFR